MSMVLLAMILLATSLVILSGIWVTGALIAAVWRVDRPDSSAPTDTSDKNAM